MSPESAQQNTSSSHSNRGDQEHLDLLADYLECLRETADLRPGLTSETKLELEECLALAEAALRRAHLESQL